MARALEVSMKASGRDRVARAASPGWGRHRPRRVDNWWLARAGLAGRHFEHAERKAIREGAGEERHRDVVDRHAVLGLAFELASMRMAMQDQRDRVAADRFFET